MNLTTAVLITGGASGIGKACAEALARQGRPIMIWDIDSKAAATIASQIQKKLSFSLVFLRQQQLD